MAEKIELSREEAVRVGVLLKRFQGYWDALVPRFDNFEEYYKAFRFYRDPESHAYKHNISKPFIFTMVMSFVAQILNTLYERTRVFDISPTEGIHFFRPEIDDEKIADQLQRAVNNIALNPDFYLFEETQDLITGLGIYGNGTIQTLPVFDDSTRYIGSKTQYIDIWDFIPRPRTYLLDEKRDFFTREIVDRDELEEVGKQRGYKNLDKVDESTVIPDDIKDKLFSQLGLTDTFNSGIDKKTGNVLLLHWHKDGHIVTIAGNKVIVKDTRDKVSFQTPFGDSISVSIKPFPYFPFDMIKLNAVPKEFYGIGLAEAAMQYQENANLRGSQRNENIELALMKTFLVNYLFDIDPENIVMGGGNIILTNDINNSMKVLDVPDITSSSYNEDQIEKFEAQDALGINEALRGSFQKVRTATTDVLAQRAGLRRMQVVLRGMSNNWRSIGRKIILQIRTFMPQEDYERLIGEPDAGLYRLNTDELNRMYDVTPSSTSLDLVREQDQQNFIQAWQVLSQQPDIINRQELARFYFRQFFPNINSDKFIAQAQQGMQPQQPGMIPPPNPQNQGLGQGNFNPQQILQGQTG